MGRKKPFLSIIVYLNNNLTHFKKCVYSCKNIWNIELIVINNIMDKNKVEEIEKWLSTIKDIRITYYNSDVTITKNSARNIGLDLANGDWLLFLEANETLTKSFVKYLNSKKLNRNIDFYRLKISYSKIKKDNFGFAKSKFYSVNSSSFLINDGFLEKVKLRWDDSIIIADTIPFLINLYKKANVNIGYLKFNAIFSVNKNNSILLKKQDEYNNKLIEAYELLKIKKRKYAKKAIIFLLLTVLDDINYSKQKTISKDIIITMNIIKRDAKLLYVYLFGLNFKNFIRANKLWIKFATTWIPKKNKDKFRDELH